MSATAWWACCSPGNRRDGSTASVNKMIKVFGAPIPKEDVETIASYLAQNYGAPPKDASAK
jgi:hypothetical protein